MDLHAELRWISDHSHQLWRAVEARGGTVPVAERLTLAEREVVLWERLAAERPRSRTTRLSLELAQHRVVELRADAPVVVTRMTVGHLPARWDEQRTPVPEEAPPAVVPLGRISSYLA
jgi:hypothetical protein